jgi:hypothetical protein
MNSKLKRLLALCALFVLFMLVPVFAQPGSVDDPLVSKKYVDDQVNALRTLISQNAQNTQIAPPPQTVTNTEVSSETRNALVAEAIAAYEQIYGDLLRQAAANAGSSGNAVLPPQVTETDAPFFQVVYAESGKIIYGDSSTEFILRGGTANVVSGVNGLCDVTSGVDLVNGQEVPYNHLIIVPVGDGRGLLVTSNAYLMIKGGYYFG